MTEKAEKQTVGRQMKTEGINTEQGQKKAVRQTEMTG